MSVTLNSEKLSIIDLYGNEIKISDIEAAITQAKGGVGGTSTQIPFRLTNGLSEDIKGREDERSTLGEYWADALVKLQNIKKGISITSVLTCNKRGYNDYDILNHPLIHRAKVVPGLKKGEVFNVYYGESSKMGVAWKGELLLSLIESGICEKKYFIKTHLKKDSSPQWDGVIGEAAQIVKIKELEEEEYHPTIDHAFTEDVYNIAFTVQGSKAKSFETTSIISNEATLIDDITWTIGISEFKPKGFPAVSNMELAVKMKALINAGISYKDNFVDGYSFELLPYFEAI
jgi:hypothetical protein